MTGVPVSITSAASTTATPGGWSACDVHGNIAPQEQFEAFLPTSTWRQLYLQTGCGGFCGTVSIAAQQATGCVPLTQRSVRHGVGQRRALRHDRLRRHVRRRSAAPRGLRPSVRAHARGVHEEADQDLLRHAAVLLVLRRLLAGRSRRADGGAAVPARLQRHRGRRARQHHPAAERLVPDVERAGQPGPERAAHPDRGQAAGPARRGGQGLRPAQRPGHGPDDVHLRPGQHPVPGQRGQHGRLPDRRAGRRGAQAVRRAARRAGPR